jgi:hypothetical protein
MSDLVALFLVAAIISGAGSARLAQQSGRNPKLWFVIGAVLPIVAIGLMQITKPKNGRRSS